MLALKIADVRGFMNKLLIEKAFDGLEFREAVISSFIRFELTGKAEGLLPWNDVRPAMFGIIKGKQKPSVLKIVLSYPGDRTEEIDPAAHSLFINIAFENEAVRLTTGFAAKKFSLDKGPEARWDAYVADFLANAGIVCETDLQ